MVQGATPLVRASLHDQVPESVAVELGVLQLRGEWDPEVRPFSNIHPQGLSLFEHELAEQRNYAVEAAVVLCVRQYLHHDLRISQRAREDDSVCELSHLSMQLHGNARVVGVNGDRPTVCYKSTSYIDKKATRTYLSLQQQGIVNTLHSEAIHFDLLAICRMEDGLRRTPFSLEHRSQRRHGQLDHFAVDEEMTVGFDTELDDNVAIVETQCRELVRSREDCKREVGSQKKCLTSEVRFILVGRHIREDVARHCK
ncbi:hypothetical protein KC331_g77 [Hortaea werneckii]|nr:hypothetical protein KC331_g77 [Hortaea werneckii]